MIIEYKLHMGPGGMYAPNWVLDGGYFYNPDNFSLVGTTLNNDVREFYLPDSVVELNRVTLKERQLGINALHPTTPPTPNAEIEAQVDAWCDAHGEP